MEKEKKRKGKRATKKVFASIPRVPSRCSYVKISKRLLGSYFRRDRRPKIGSVLSISHIWISKSFFPSFLFLFVFVYQTLEIVHWKWVSIYIYICLRNFPLEIVFFFKRQKYRARIIKFVDRNEFLKGHSKILILRTIIFVIN